MQVDLGKMMKVTGVITQGRGDYNQWVTSYLLMTSVDGTNFDYVLGGNGKYQVRMWVSGVQYENYIFT